MYNNFAKGYFSIMKDTLQNDFFCYYKKIFEKFNINPELILDLGCGTGDITYLFAKENYDMIGIDISYDMLNIAKENNSHKNILYLNQDMREFELYGTVDVIYSSLDCINYITDKRDLKKIFKLCNNYLNPDGLFIFDINTEYKYKNVLDNKTYIYDNEEAYLIWQSEYDKKRKMCTFFLDMFYKEKDSYIRSYEEQEQRAYEVDELIKTAELSGFRILAIYDNLSFKKYNKKSEKVFFVLRKENVNER